MLPLKEDHKILMFEQCLVPLHRSKFLGNFHSSLLKAITVFLKKDGSVAELAIFACLKYWPQTDPYKEVSFLNEIDIILNTVKNQELLVECRDFLFQRIGKCARSKHYAVAERALLLIHNPTIAWLLREYVHTEPHLMIYLVDAICYNCVNTPTIRLGQNNSVKPLLPSHTLHWKESVRGMSFFAAKKILVEVDKRLYDKAVSEFTKR